MTKNAIIILGMHRSGTSVLARILSILGGSLPNTLLGSNEGNQRGHWESEVLIAKNEEFLSNLGSSWQDFRLIKPTKMRGKSSETMRENISTALREEYEGKENWIIKEPRLCRMAQLYFDTLKSQGVNSHIIIAIRNPLEVAGSLHARDKIPIHQGLLMWLTHMLEAERVTRDMPRSFVHYEDLLDAPTEEMKRLLSEMKVLLPYSELETQDQIERFVTPSLKRQRRADEDLRMDPMSEHWIAESYSAFQVLRRNSDSQAALKILDDIRNSYYPAIEFLYKAIENEKQLLLVNETQLRAHNTAIAEYEEKKARTEEMFSKEVHTLRDNFDKEKTHKKQLLAEVQCKNVSIEALDKEISSMRDIFSDIIDEKDDALATALKDEAMLRSVLNVRDEHITALNAEMDSVLSSSSWKMTSVIRKALNLVKGNKSTQKMISEDSPPRLTYDDTV
ncbi:MAG: sulfotransferase family protein [Maricaulaceae bacterium]